MNEQDLRALVRDAVARHLGGSGTGFQAPAAALAPGSPPWRSHPSHGVYALVNVGEACLIEPSVECTHCEFCKSHGH